ncbi:MAG: hypothetical protein JWM80_579 [Cyanobacteria bacterium RYN_339]|nr:hypothetical protein [Cyanobacteria bacterium RYN_339]
MKLLTTTVALAAMMLAGIGMGSANVQAADGEGIVAIPLEGRSLRFTDEDRANAFTTMTHPLTPSAAEKRVAAVTYMDDALALLEMARTHLREGQESPQMQRMALSELMAASGKVTTAYLLLFHDREASRRVAPLAAQIELAERVCLSHPAMAAALIDRNRPALAAIYTGQLATMGGGAGSGALEDLKHR